MKMMLLLGLWLLGGLLPSEDRLAAAAAQMRAGAEIGFGFSARDAGARTVYAAEGTLHVWGDKFRMEIPEDLLVVCNGSVKWIYRPEAGELMIAEHHPQEADLLENPFSILENAGRQYRLSAGAAGVSGGKATETVVLTPRESGNGYARIEIVLEKDTAVPVRIAFFSKDGAQYAAEVRSFRPLQSRGAEQFELDPSAFPDAVVTDLR